MAEDQVWHAQAPQSPGFYWLTSRSPDGSAATRIVQVFHARSGLRFRCASKQGDEPLASIASGPCLWRGPLDPSDEWRAALPGLTGWYWVKGANLLRTTVFLHIGIDREEVHGLGAKPPPRKAAELGDCVWSPRLEP